MVSKKMSALKERWEKIQNEVRAFPNVQILAVTKGQPVERVQEGIECGILLLGDNYFQEGESLRAQLKTPKKITWHYIGHIQSRKAKSLAEVYDCVQTVDRKEVAQKIHEAATKPIEVLIEVNIGREPQKAGVHPEHLQDLMKEVKSFSRLALKGLMAMPPLEPMPARKKYFQEMQKIFLSCGFHPDKNTLSMGTSDDYLMALEEGANLIRLGTALYGPRI